MAEYREGSHSRYDLKIHHVRMPKYQKKVLVGDIEGSQWVSKYREEELAEQVRTTQGDLKKNVSWFLQVPSRNADFAVIYL